MTEGSGEKRQRRKADPPPSLGSLSRSASAPGATARQCSQCGSRAVTQLAMDLTDGTPVTFVSCQACEHRTWFDAEGTELPIASVLKRSKREK